MRVGTYFTISNLTTTKYNECRRGGTVVTTSVHCGPNLRDLGPGLFVFGVTVSFLEEYEIKYF